MKCWREPQLYTFGPDRVIVILTIEAERIKPRRLIDHVGMLLDMGRNRTPDHASQHDDLEAELRGDVFQLGNSLFGSVHGNDRRRGHAIGEGAEEIRTKSVKR